MNRKGPLQTLELSSFSLSSDDTVTLHDLYSERTKIINSQVLVNFRTCIDVCWDGYLVLRWT